MEKRYEDLTFTDDFLFGKILQNNKVICKALLELILDVKIKEIRFPEVQKSVKIKSDGKGVRFDVFVDDDVNTVYDVEMQTTGNRNLPKRSRYYQGMIDLNLIETGDDYGKLKKSFVIFICLQDPFGSGRHIYTFENVCREEPLLKLGDGTTKVFLNADSTADDVSGELKDFLTYLASGTPKGAFTAAIDIAVRETKSSMKWRGEYMTLLMRDHEKVEEGKFKAAATFVQQGAVPIAVAADMLHISPEELIEKMNQAGYKMPVR